MRSGVVRAAGCVGADGVFCPELQEAQSLVPAGCACGLEGKHRRLLSTVLGIAFVAGALRQFVLAVQIPRSTLSASSRRQRQAPPGSTSALLAERRGFGVGRVWFLDIQGWIALVLGGLLALITLFTSYSHVRLPFLGAVELTPGWMALGLENVEPCVYTSINER
jgi:hypothetical protein